jgi:hypothetical protein
VGHDVGVYGLRERESRIDDDVSGAL